MGPLRILALVSLLGSAAARAELPAIDHILLEVRDVDESLRFYRDQLGLKVKSRKGDFVILKTANVDVALWGKRWKWSPQPAGLRPPAGIYPHLAVQDVKAVVARLEKAGYRIVGRPQWHVYGTEAFVADPDGYVWSFISARK